MNVSPSRSGAQRGRCRIGCVLLTCTVLAGCGTAPRAAQTSGLPAALVAGARPIGTGLRFHPPATGPVIGRCRHALGARFGVHVELFAADRVVLIAAGIGARPPLGYSEGRIARARCYGDLVTVEPTGVVLIRAGSRARLSELFRSWGQPLSTRRLGPFRASDDHSVTVFIDGRRWGGPPGDVRLVRHSEIVLEVGPYVPPHSFYGFPPGS